MALPGLPSVHSPEPLREYGLSCTTQVFVPLHPLPSLPKTPPSFWETPNFLGTARAPQGTQPSAAKGLSCTHQVLPLCTPSRFAFKFLLDFGAFLAKNNL